MKSVSIIGVGRVGGAFALALDNIEFTIDKLVVRSSANANKIVSQMTTTPKVLNLGETEDFSSDVIIIATQDSEIEAIIRKLAKIKFKKNTYIFHTSGSYSSEVLNKLGVNNCKVGSIHPLISISDSQLGIKRFRDAYFCVEGDKAAVDIANEIVKDLGGKPFSIDSKYKSLYHASAVVACGHIVALIDASMEMLQKCGLESDTSKEILMPLIKSTIDNLTEQQNSDALTGTFARADVGTFEKHLETIKENTSGEVLEIYLSLGERSLKLAKQQGIDAERIEKMSKKISLAKKNLKC